MTKNLTPYPPQNSFSRLRNSAFVHLCCFASCLR